MFILDIHIDTIHTIISEVIIYIHVNLNPTDAYSVTIAAMFSSDAEVKKHIDNAVGIPRLTSPISTGIIVQLQNGEITPSPIAKKYAHILFNFTSFSLSLS